MTLFAEKELVEFALRWAPYGGPPASKVFVQFGLRPEQYKRVLAPLLHTHEMTTAERAALRSYVELSIGERHGYRRSRR